MDSIIDKEGMMDRYFLGDDGEMHEIQHEYIENGKAKGGWVKYCDVDAALTQAREALDGLCKASVWDDEFVTEKEWRTAYNKAQATVTALRTYIEKRIEMTEYSLQVEVLAGNAVKESNERHALAELHGVVAALPAATEGGNMSNKKAPISGESKTRVVNLYRESYDVYIGRPDRWGNPYKYAARQTLYGFSPRDARWLCATRAEAVAKHREWLKGQPQLIADAKRILIGKRLGCFCKDKNGQGPCHGDNLVDAIEGTLT